MQTMFRAIGFQLVELMLVLAALGVVVALATPDLLRVSANLRTRLAAEEVAGALRRSKSLAVRENRYVAVKFRTGGDGRVSFTLYRDGDGDGVRNRDIDSGVDPPVGPSHPLRHLGRHVRFGFPPGPAPRDPGDPRRRLGRLQDPIRFQRSDLASFGPLGGSTPGSVYLTDGQRSLAAVRVLGRTGRVRILLYDRATERWR